MNEDFFYVYDKWYSNEDRTSYDIIDKIFRFDLEDFDVIELNELYNELKIFEKRATF